MQSAEEYFTSWVAGLAHGTVNRFGKLAAGDEVLGIADDARGEGLTPRFWR